MFRLTLECPHKDCHATEVIPVRTTVESDTTIFEMLCAGTGHHFFVAIRPDWRRAMDGHYYSKDRKTVVEVATTLQDVTDTREVVAAKLSDFK